uniref:ABC transmembrane type-1 domain-containing protein n=1 Tax=Panagrellus redivivus TaxID=6233 RepID=A0A7E4V223_PANRE
MQAIMHDFAAVDYVFKKHPFTMGYNLDSSNILKLVTSLLWYGMMALIPLVVILMMVMIFMMQRLKKHLPLHKYRLHTMLSR